MGSAANLDGHWRTIVIALLVPLLILSSSGCATLFTPAFQEVPVASTPEGAEVWIDGELVGTTPITVRVKANEDHEVVVKLGEQERGWTLERRIGTPGGLGITGDVLILVPTGLIGLGLIAYGSSSECGGWFDPCGPLPGVIAGGVGASVVALTPLVVDLATNQFFELTPKEITAEF